MMYLARKIYSKSAQKIRHTGRDMGYLLGINKRFFNNARGNRILIYHGICLRNHTKFNPIFLTLKTFEEHLKLYKKHCHVISLDDFYAQNFSKDKFNICLTFDDGFANNYKYVKPLLEKYQLHATFFITAIRDTGYDILWNDFLGIISKYGPETISYKNQTYYKGQHDKYISVDDGIKLVEKLRFADFTEKAEMMQLLYPLGNFKKNKADEDYWLQMTKEEIRDLSRSEFVTIGAHGYYHNDLSRIDPDKATCELAKSKHYLESVTGKNINSFAFPYGAYNPAVIDEAKKAGYNQLLAMDFLYDDDKRDASMRERFTVNPFISPVNQLYATITRHYD